MENLFYLFFLIPVVAANLGERSQAWRAVTYAMLITFNAGILALAAMALLMQQMVLRLPDRFPAAFDGVNWPVLVITIVITGLVAWLPLVPAVRRWLGTVLATDPGSPVHTTALVFAVYQVGATLAQTALLGTIEALAGPEFRVGFLDLVVSGIWFTLLALAGTGFLLRRNARQVAERLGLAWPTWRQAAAAAVVLVVLLGLGLVIDMAWRQLDPAGYDRIDRVSRNLFGDLSTVWGALALGLSAGIGEELLFRGAVQPRLRLLPTALLFASGHLQYGLSPAAVQVFIIGLALGVLRNRANTTLCIAVHALYNILNVILS